MSTRAQVRVVCNGCPMNFYRHSDGYPAGLGNDLKAALLDVLNGKHLDDDEKAETVSQKLVMHLGCEPTFTMHFGIEYFYLLDFDTHAYEGWRTRHAWDDVDDDDDEWYAAMPKTSGETINLLKDNLDD